MNTSVLSSCNVIFDFTNARRDVRPIADCLLRFASTEATSMPGDPGKPEFVAPSGTRVAASTRNGPDVRRTNRPMR